MAAESGAGKTSLEELERDITCPVCQEHYNDPKFLPCYHYYCKKCIIRLAHKSVFLCPECQEEITLTEDGVDGLKSAFTVNQLKSTYAAMKEMYEEKHGPAGNVTRKESSTQQSTMDCLVHNTTLDIYCHNCKSFICNRCRVTSHKQHKSDPIKKAASAKKNMLLNELNPLEKEEECMLSALREVAASKKDVEEQGKMVAHSIKDSFRELHKILERREQQMLLECEDKVTTKLERLLKQENDLYLEVKQMKTTIDHFKSLVGNSTITDVLTQHSQVQHHLSLKVKEHCENKKTTAPVEEADLKVEVSMAQELQTLCQSNAKVTTIPQCYLDLPHRNVRNEVNKATLTVCRPRIVRSVSCRIEHLDGKTVKQCETEQQHDDNTKYSISYIPTRFGVYKMIATVNGQDLATQSFETEDCLFYDDDDDDDSLF